MVVFLENNCLHNDCDEETSDINMCMNSNQEIYDSNICINNYESTVCSQDTRLEVNKNDNTMFFNPDFKEPVDSGLNPLAPEFTPPKHVQNINGNATGYKDMGNVNNTYITEK